MVSYQEIVDVVQQLSKRNAGFRHRRLICLSGERYWGEQIVSSILDKFPNSSHIWVGDQLPGDIESTTVIPSTQARRYLGTEQGNIVLNAWDGFDPDALGALAGTVLPGGFLFVLAPCLIDWPNHPDPVSSRLLSEGQSLPKEGSYYLKRLCDCLLGDMDALLIHQGAPLPSISTKDFPLGTSSKLTKPLSLIHI